MKPATMYPYDYGMSVQQTRDNGYIVAGQNTSLGAGGADTYLIKVGPDQPPDADYPFIRGDADVDGKADITDAVSTLGHLFRGNSSPPCLAAADADDSGSLEITDAIFLLQHLFQGGAAPPPPYPECGLDSTPDDLTCEGSGCP